MIFRKVLPSSMSTVIVACTARRMRHRLSARALRFRLEFGRPYVRRAPRPLSAMKNGADSEEKHQPARDIDTVAVDSLKALDPKRPIREVGRPYQILRLSIPG